MVDPIGGHHNAVLNEEIVSPVVPKNFVHSSKHLLGGGDMEGSVLVPVEVLNDEVRSFSLGIGGDTALPQRKKGRPRKFSCRIGGQQGDNRDVGRGSGGSQMPLVPS